MMLEYLISHEDKLQEILLYYSSSAADVPDEDVLTSGEAETLLPDFNTALIDSSPTVEDVQRVTLELYRRLITELETIREQLRGSQVLLELVEKEKRELKKLARNFDFQEDI